MEWMEHDGTILAMAAMDMLCMSQGHADRHRAGKGGSVPGQNRLGPMELATHWFHLVPGISLS